MIVQADVFLSSFLWCLGESIYSQGEKIIPRKLGFSSHQEANSPPENWPMPIRTRWMSSAKLKVSVKDGQKLVISIMMSKRRPKGKVFGEGPSLSYCNFYIIRTITEEIPQISA